MLAIYKRELRSFFHGMMGYVCSRPFCWRLPASISWP